MRLLELVFSLIVCVGSHRCAQSFIHPGFPQRSFPAVTQRLGKLQRPRTTWDRKYVSPIVHVSGDFELDAETIDAAKFRSASYAFLESGTIGILVGWSVGVFKLSVATLSGLCSARRAPFDPFSRPLFVFIPVLGGLGVALLQLPGAFPPGLRGIVEYVDEKSSEPQKEFTSGFKSKFRSLRKSAAAVLTLGTGNSLGPEGPAVEIGMSMSRLIMDVFPRMGLSGIQTIKQNRLLLAAGAAAGVSAGFSAPIAGTFFALEVMQGAFQAIDNSNPDLPDVSPKMAATSRNISTILFASVLSSLVCHTLIGDHLVFDVKGYQLKTPLLELPLYVLLGVLSGTTAYAFSIFQQSARKVFSGEMKVLNAPFHAKRVPSLLKPVLGGLFCGVLGFVVPEILFDGHTTINKLLARSVIPPFKLIWMLLAKMTATAVSSASGLVGGTFAPSLFFGGMVGAIFHGVASTVFRSSFPSEFPLMLLADLPAYVMMGSASVLAALFHAPLTACLLLFELTRDYSIILPLMATCGVASVISDVLGRKKIARQITRPLKLPPGEQDEDATEPETKSE